MSEITQAERYLLEQIRAGQEQAWRRLVERYQGRLYVFAQSRLPQSADAEDVVQDTFIGLLRGLEKFRGAASLETYLFGILRRKIIDSYRGRATHRICLLQDMYEHSTDHSAVADAFERIPSPDPTASWYVRTDEQHELEGQALGAALRELFDGLKISSNLRDLQIVELILYCRLANKDVAAVMGMGEKAIALIKHRCLKRIRARVSQLALDIDDESGRLEDLLTQICQTHRLSCPKRSTIGGYLLGTLDPSWHAYVDFHVNRLGCLFCRANLADLKHHDDANEPEDLRRRIIQSSVGFLRTAR